MSRADARALLHGVEVPARGQGDALASAAMVAVRKITDAGGRPLPADVPPAKVLGASASANDDDAINVWLIIGLFAVVFLPSLLLFEVWIRVSRRRRDRLAEGALGPDADTGH